MMTDIPFDDELHSGSTNSGERAKTSRKPRVVDESYDGEVIGDVISDPPDGCENHRVPTGWMLADESASAALRIWKRTQNGGYDPAEVCHNPILVSGWVRNGNAKNKAVEVSWKALGRWHSAIADREELADAKSIVKALARRGASVDCNNAKPMVKYITDYINTNVKDIPIRNISLQQGWQENGTFLWGDECLNVDGEDDVQFHALDAGEEQMVKALRQNGTMDGWRAAIIGINDYPLVELGLYASLAAPLLEILDCPNFIVDWSYRTSSGKTTVLRMAASVWGCPDERSSKSMIMSWDTTSVGLERAAATRSHMPLIVDDTKRAQSFRGQSSVKDYAFMAANGIGRVRGSVKGSRALPSWRTILLSSGEQRLIDHDKTGGLVARSLCLWGPPFGGECPETTKLVRKLNSQLIDHYGHIGPHFVTCLQTNRDHWEDWRKEYRELKISLGERASGISGVGVAHRIAEYLAVLELTGRLANQWLELPWVTYRSPVDRIFGTLTESSSEADRATEAREHIYNWAVANSMRFFGQNQDDDIMSKNRLPWLGKWRHGEDWECIEFVPDSMRQELTRAGYDAEATIRIWAERYWLEGAEYKHLARQSRIDGKKMRLYALKKFEP